jgi:hypothetical protein
VLFFFQASAERGQAYFGERWPEARGVADARRWFYKAFDIGQASLRQTVAPDMMLAGLRAYSKGNRQGATEGDAMQLPGTFLIQGDQILWQHEYAHVGDHPDFMALPEKLARYLKAEAA